MKKILSIILILSVLTTTCMSLVACNGFKGGLSAFFKDGDFYSNIGNVVFSIFAGGNSYIPLINENTLEFNSSLDVSNYAVNQEVVEDGNLDLDFSLLLNKNLNYDYTVNLEAFDSVDVYKRCVQEDNKMLLDYGRVLNYKPLCYYDEGYNCFTEGKNELEKCIESANFSQGKENYALNGVNFKTDTVSFTLNSDVLTKWITDLTNDLFSSNSTQDGVENLKDNLIYSEWYYPMIEIANTFKDEKLHLKWTRYFADDALCRETLNLYDPNNHYIVLDLAYSDNDGAEHAEISVKANGGSAEFEVLSLSATRTNNGEKFTTDAKIMIGDELLATTTNSGDGKKASGNAKINVINTVGEQQFVVNYNFSGERAGDKKSNGLGLKQKVDINVNLFPMIGTDNMISFDAVLQFYGNTTDKKPIVESFDDYFDLSTLADMYYYHSVGQLDFDKALEAVKTYLGGEKANYTVPTPIVSPYKLDLRFDDGKTYETNGSYGKEYVETLMSDEYTFKYNYHTNELGYPLNYGAEYIKDGKQYYTYDYAIGEDYAIYHEGTTIYEVRHEIEKIIYTEYDKETYEYTYPRTTYIYDHSGYCDYEGKQYVYEQYFDYYVNKYYLIFNEDKELELMLLISSVDDSSQCLFIEELKATASAEDFVLPDYEKVDVLDYFE